MTGAKSETTLDSDGLELQRLLKLDTTPWYKKPNLRKLYLCLVPAAIGVEMTTGYDGSVLNGLQAVHAWKEFFGYPGGATLGVLNAAYNLGGLISLPIVPYVNDRYGRKHSITLGSIIVCIGVALQSATVNYGMFLAARLIAGMGIAFAVSGASQLLAELTYPRERSILTGLFNACWFTGAILAAGVTLATHRIPSDWSWRIPTILQIGPSVLQLMFIWFVPDSPRWLISKDRGEEAFEVLVEYHAEGDRDNAFVQAEFAQISTQIMLETESSKRRWVELLKTSGNRKRVLVAVTVGIFTQWSGNGLISYYLARVLTTIGIKNERTQNVINLSLSCFNLVITVSCSFLTRILKRRVQYLTAFIAMVVTFAIWTACSAHYAQNENTQAANAVLAMIFLYYFSYNIMQPLTYVYVTEVFPFIYRAKGVALLQIFTRGATAFNTFVNPIGLDSIEWKFFIVYVGWLVVEIATIYWLYPETQGKSLEELARLFEGDTMHAPRKLIVEHHDGAPKPATAPIA